MRDILSEDNSLLYNVCVHNYIAPAREICNIMVNDNHKERKMPQSHTINNRRYIAPNHIKPFNAITQVPSHTGILALIREAKDNNNHWANAALAEISFITGINYKFVPSSRAWDYAQKYEIEIAP